MLCLDRYLAEHPEYIAQGVELSHFSFKSPAPLQKDYVRKRSQTSQSGVTQTGSSKPLQLYITQIEHPTLMFSSFPFWLGNGHIFSVMDLMHLLEH